MGLSLRDRSTTFLCVGVVLAGMTLAGCSRSNQPNDANLSERVPAVADDEAPEYSGSLDDLLQRATVAIERRRFEEAIGLLRPLLVTQADNPAVLFLFAQCEAGLGDLAAAVTTLERIPPDHPEAGFAAVGQATDWLLTLKRYDDAESKLRRLVETHPKVPFAHRRLAQLLNNQGRRSDAAPHMQTLVRLGDATESELFGMHAFSEPFIHTLPPTMGATDIPSIGLSESRLMLMEGKIREAREHAEGLRASDPESTSIAAFLGRVYAELHDDEALAKRARSLPSDIQREPEFWYAAGVWYQNQSLHPTAVRCFAEAVRRDQTDRASFLSLARSLAIAEKPELAKRAMSRYQVLEEANLIVIEQQRTRPQLQRLVQILDTLRRPEEARAWETLASRMPEVESSLYTRPQDTEIDSAHVASDSGESKEAWLLCGIEPDDWPLPKFADLADRMSARQSEPNTIVASLSLIDVAKVVGLDFRHRS